jgi:putative hemolysin
MAFAALVGWIARRMGADPDRWQVALGTAELLDLIDSGAASGALDPMEREILSNVFELDDITVERLMTPRTEMFSLPLTLPWEELVKRCRDSERARIPIHGSRADDIVGVLLLKDLLKHRSSPPAGPRQLRSLLVPPVFVPASRSADSMLREFLEKQFQMAFVVDEHGTLLGLVTLDDLLQELMGEDDATTPESAPERPGGPWLLDGQTDVDDFRAQTGLELPAGEYHTLGGFVFFQLGRLPRRGDQVTWSGHTFAVRDMDGRRISQVEVEAVRAQVAS